MIHNQIYALKSALGFQLAMLTKGMQQQMQRHFHQAGHAITFEQWTVLLSLWSTDGQSQQELARDTHRDETSLSRLITTMVGKQLVTRRPSPQDRRINLICLTERGKQLAPLLIAEAGKVNALAVQGIDPQALAVFRDVLQQMARNVQ